MIKAKKVYFLIVLIMSAIYTLKAQDDIRVHQAPSLQLGLNGLTYSKGDLDAQLIMQIIAEKQQEIKVRLIENMFLNGVDKSGGTIYNYTSNILNSITQEANPEIRTKIILESTVNFAFVYHFTEYIKSNNKDVLEDIRTEVIEIHLEENKINKIKKHDNIYTKKINKINKSPKEVKVKKLLFEKDIFNILLLDIASEVIKNNTILKELGVMQVEQMNSYNTKNKFIRIKRIYDSKIYDEKDSVYYKHCEYLYNLMEKELKNITKTIGLANYYIKEYSFISQNYNINPNQTGGDSFNYQLLLEEIDNTIKLIKKKWTNESDSIFSISLTELSNIQNIILKTERLDNTNYKDSINFESDLIYVLNSKVIPILRKYSKFNSSINATLNSTSNILLLRANNLLYQKNTTNVNHKHFYDNILVKLLGLLYEFDKPETYLEFINMIPGFENFLTNPLAKSTLNTLNNYISNSVSLNSDINNEKYVDINIDSFLSNIINTRKNTLTPFDFHFTVGLNNIFFVESLDIHNGTKINNYSFVSEKIGAKYKILNPGAWRNRKIGDVYKNRYGVTYEKTASPTQPLIDNLYVLLYGSGILYNITNMGTNKDFNYPIIGLGAGVTLYNSLDINFTWGFPIDNQLTFSNNFKGNRSYIGFGVDIQFLDYFNRLSRNIKNNRTQKRLSK